MKEARNGFLTLGGIGRGTILCPYKNMHLEVSIFGFLPQCGVTTLPPMWFETLVKVKVRSS
jgi:hypothetical protein